MAVHRRPPRPLHLSPAPPAAPPAADTLLRDVLAGLTATPKTLPSKYFYDEAGSRLFERITELEAYYPTRTELAILRAYVAEIAEGIGPRAALIEYGSGSSLKTRVLLDALPDLAAYVPIDISAAHLHATVEQLRDEYPDLPVRPVEADYTRPFALPALPPSVRRRVVFFPGSTIGNFLPEEAERFLTGVARVAGPGGGLVLGVDLKKDPAVLERAYDDPEGVTAAFNRNLLLRLNRELGADFDPAAFRHLARYAAAEGRVEMHLVSERDQTVRVDGRPIAFAAGETIHTENSYKYDVDGVAAMAERAGLRLQTTWTDPHRWFAVLLFDIP